MLAFTETPLHCAAAKGNLCIAAMLIEKGAKVNARNHNGCTPLWLAASQGHYSVVHLLLQQPGVDVDCPCGDVFLKRSGDDVFLRRSGDDVFLKRSGYYVFLKRSGYDVFLKRSCYDVFGKGQITIFS